MVSKEGQPALDQIRIFRRSFHPTGDGSLGKFKTGHAEFPMDPRRSRRAVRQEMLHVWPSPELWHSFQFLEGRCERVREAPHRPRRELLMLGIEVAIMYDASQVPGYLKFSLDEGSIDDDELAASLESGLVRQVSTCRRISSKFRCGRRRWKGCPPTRSSCCVSLRQA